MPVKNDRSKEDSVQFRDNDSQNGSVLVNNNNQNIDNNNIKIKDAEKKSVKMFHCLNKKSSNEVSECTESDSEMSFAENSKRYKCCCSCCHIKTACLIIGSIELLILVMHLISTISLYVRSRGNSNTNYDNNHNNNNNNKLMLSFCLNLTAIVICLITIVLLFIAVVKIRPRLILPHLFVQIIIAILLLVWAAFCIVGLIFGSNIILRIINMTTADDNNNNKDFDKNLHNMQIFNDGDSHIPRAHPAGIQQFQQTGPVLQIQTHILTVFLAGGAVFFLIAFVIQSWLAVLVFRCFRFLSAKALNDKTNGNGTSNESIFEPQITLSGQSTVIVPAKSPETNI